jgi:hypothetical protein
MSEPHAPTAVVQTLLTITHTLLPHDLTSPYVAGWTHIAGHLADRLRTRPAA